MGLVEAGLVPARCVLFSFTVLMLLPSIAGEGFVREIHLPLNPIHNRITANANSIDAVCEEVLHPAALLAIASAHSIRQEAVKGIEVSRSRDGAAVVVRQAPSSSDALGVIADELGWYIRGRAKGHSAAFLFGCLTNRAWRLPNPDSDMKALAERHPNLPTALLRRWESGAYTNRAGTAAEVYWGSSDFDGRLRDYTNTTFRSKDQVVSWTDYILVDGELVWIYQARHPPSDPAIENVIFADAKEFDSRYRELILRAEEEARAELRGRGDTKLPQWRVDRLKKEKLKTQGIDWRSPADLISGPHSDWQGEPNSE